MIHIRVFVFGAFAAAAGIAVLGACGDDELHAPFVEEADAPDLPDALAPPIVHDAAPSKSDYDASAEPVVCTSTPCVTQLVAGMNHFCALLDDGSVRCWGRDVRGSLGRGAFDDTPSPMSVVGITNATQISASSVGDGTTCVRNAVGRVQCWGANDYAQLGLQVSPALLDGAIHATPTDVALTSEVARVDVGPRSVCALGMSGAIYCWGYDSQGQLARLDAGTSDYNTYRGPGLADLGNYEITRIALGYESVFGLTKSAQLVGWGKPSGRDSSLTSGGPLSLPTLSDVTDVSVGGDDSNGTYCAIAGGSVYCWGSNQSGGLGTGIPDGERLPAVANIHTDGKTFPQQLALATNRSCVRMTDGTIHCCGNNRFGQLGLGQLGAEDAGTLGSVFVFTRARAFEEHAVQVAVSTTTTCALVQGGKVMCWGGNSHGELGQGTRDAVAHPTPVTVIFQ